MINDLLEKWVRLESELTPYTFLPYGIATGTEIAAVRYHPHDGGRPIIMVTMEFAKIMPRSRGVQIAIVELSKIKIMEKYFLARKRESQFLGAPISEAISCLSGLNLPLPKRLKNAERAIDPKLRCLLAFHDLILGSSPCRYAVPTSALTAKHLRREGEFAIVDSYTIFEKEEDAIAEMMSTTRDCVIVDLWGKDAVPVLFPPKAPYNEDDVPF